MNRFVPTDNYDEIGPAMREFMAYTATANAVGAPAMSVPLYWTEDGLPIGSHLLALPGVDMMLLKLAYELEAARGWKHKWAPFSIRGTHH